MQSSVRRVLHPVERRYKTRQSHLRFPTLNTRFYTDTLFSTTKSIQGNTCAQIFTNASGFDLLAPLKKEADAHESLNEFIRTVGVPKELVSDGGKAQIQGKFAAAAKEYKVKQRVVVPYSGWQNRAEAAIREIKRSVRRALHTSRAPKRLWDYCGEWIVAVRRLTAHDIAVLNNRVPEEVVSGNTPDISEYAHSEGIMIQQCSFRMIQRDWVAG